MSKTSDKIKGRINILQSRIDTVDADGFDEYTAGEIMSVKSEIEFLRSILTEIEAAEQKAIYASWNDEILRDYQEREYQERW
jgi:hypothetical protein